jgi:hypothetical protein
VDHFNPKKKRRCGYDNLFPVYEPCNEAKQDSWPVEEQKRLGMRLLNPCVENDYNEQIFENPETHELVPANEAAEYHIGALDLDNRSLVTMRKDRALKKRILESRLLEANAEGIELAKKLAAELTTAIPPIDPPPKS